MSVGFCLDSATGYAPYSSGLLFYHPFCSAVFSRNHLERSITRLYTPPVVFWISRGHRWCPPFSLKVLAFVRLPHLVQVEDTGSNFAQKRTIREPPCARIPKKT